MPTNSENLYNKLVADNYDFGGYDKFVEGIKSESNLQNLYSKLVADNYDFGSYDKFKSGILDTTNKAEPVQQDNIPTVSLTPKDAGRGSYEGIAEFPIIEDIKGAVGLGAAGTNKEEIEKTQQANTQKIDAYENKLREVKNRYIDEYKASMPNTYEGYVSMLNATDDAKKVYLEKLNSPDPMVAYKTMQDIKGKLDSGDYEGDKSWIPEWAENLMAGREGESKLKIAREEKADKDNFLKNGIEGIYQEQQKNKEFGKILTAPLASNPDVLKNSFTQYGLNQMVGYNPVALDAGLSELQKSETSTLSKQMPSLIGAQLYKQQANEIFQHYTNSNEFKQANEILKNASSYPQESIDWANNFVGQVTTIGNNIGAADNFISKQTVALDEQKRQVSQNALLERMMSPDYDRPRDYTRAALTGLNIAKEGLAATIGTGVALGGGEGFVASGGNPIGAGVGALMGGVAVAPAALGEAAAITGSSATLEKYAPGAIDIADYKLKEENLKSIGWIRSLFGNVDKAIGENTVHNFDISKENGLVNPVILQAYDKNLKPTDLNFLKENWSLNVPAAFYDVVNTMSGSNVFGGVTRVSNAITKAAKLGKVGQEVAAIGANTISGIIQDDGRSIENYYKQTGNIGLSKALGVFGSGVEAFTESIWNPTGMIGLGVDDIATGARRMAFDELKNATSAIEKGAIRFAKTNIEELGEEFGGAAIMRGAVGAAQASGLSGANNLDTNQLSPLELAKTALLTIASTSPMAARAGQQEASAFRNVLNYNIGMQADDMRTHLNQQFQDNKISNSDYHQAMANVDKQQAAYQTASAPFEQAKLRVEQLYNLSQQQGLPAEVSSRLADLHQTSFDALEIVYLMK